MKRQAADPDLDPRTVKPAPETILRFVRLGAPVSTPKGPGKIADVILSVGRYANGLRLSPPQIVVKLDEPWNGEARITVSLHLCGLEDDPEAFREPCAALWPDQVPKGPPVVLRPTTEPQVKLSALLKRANETSVKLRGDGIATCQACGKELGEGEKWVCAKCLAEIKGWVGENVIDPNGAQWFSQTMRRLPLTRMAPFF